MSFALGCGQRGQCRDNSQLGRVNRYWPTIRSSGDDELPLAESAQGTNHCSYPPELPFVPPYQPPFVGTTNHGSEGVRTTVRTEESYTDSESSPEKESPSIATEAKKEGIADKEARRKRRSTQGVQTGSGSRRVGRRFEAWGHGLRGQGCRPGPEVHKAPRDLAEC